MILDNGLILGHSVLKQQCGIGTHDLQLCSNRLTIKPSFSVDSHTPHGRVIMSVTWDFLIELDVINLIVIVINLHTCFVVREVFPLFKLWFPW